MKRFHSYGPVDKDIHLCVPRTELVENLFIDEFDSLPPAVIDQLVTMFRNIYLNRDSYQLHGLALIGVKAVLGVENMKGSPFNIQRSLHAPNDRLDINRHAEIG
jgi:hypothetical protein